MVLFCYHYRASALVVVEVPYIVHSGSTDRPYGMSTTKSLLKGRKSWFRARKHVSRAQVKAGPENVQGASSGAKRGLQIFDKALSAGLSCSSATAIAQARLC